MQFLLPFTTMYAILLKKALGDGAMNAENVRPNIPKLDIHAVKDDSEKSSGTFVPLHYHDELEFIPIYKGSLLYTEDYRYSL